MSLGAAKQRLLEAYRTHAETLFADRLIGSLEARSMCRPANKALRVSVDGSIPSGQFLVATSSRGLLLWNGDTMTVLFDGAWYGLTTRHGWWYGFRKARLHGHIVRFRLVDGVATDATVFASGLSRGVHQIDFVGDDLIITDTYVNRVIELRPGTSWRESGSHHYPDGPLKAGRDSANYRHFNSIFAAGSTRFLVAHNETVKTGVKSELYEMDSNYKPLTVRSLDASNAHNFVKTDLGELWCASLEGTLRRDGHDVLAVDMFTRGLAVSDDQTLVGGSVVELVRSKRGTGPGAVFVLDAADRHVGTIEIDATEIHELRFVDRRDYGLSNGQT